MQRIQGKTFPQTHPHSCRDTITGECLTGITAERCSEICEKSELCEAAAWSNSNKECRPFYTEIYDYVNPLEFIKESDDENDIIFVNGNMWEFPSDTAGIVRTRDSFYFVTETGQTFATETAGEPLTVSNAGFVETQLIFQDIHGPNGQVEICDSLLINRPRTNLVLRSNGLGELVWEPALSDNTGILDLFTLVPKTQKKCPGNTPVKWDTKYYIEYSGRFLRVLPADSKGKSLVTFTENKRAATLWSLKPKDIEVFYCSETGEDSVCSSVDISRVNLNGTTARYNNSVVYRGSNCMLQCGQPYLDSATETVVETTKNCSIWWWILTALGIIVIILLVVLWVKAKRAL